MTAEISFLHSFINGVGMMSCSELLLDASWIKRATSHRVTSVNSYRSAGHCIGAVLATVQLEHQRVMRTGWQQSWLVQTTVYQ